MELEFNRDGLLPPGDYSLTLSDLRGSLLVHGDGSDPNWDSEWRAILVDNASKLIRQLWDVGIEEVFLDGSFVENKAFPNDVDGYFVCDLMEFASGELQQKLNRLDPHKVWTWDPKSRKPYRGSTKNQLPMWHRYRVELYPHYEQSSGIRDEFGNEQTFPAAFRKARYAHLPKGIIRVLKG